MFICCIDDGSVFVKGYGALGLGPELTEVKSFQAIHFEEEENVVSIKCAPDYIAVLTGTKLIISVQFSKNVILLHMRFCTEKQERLPLTVFFVTSSVPYLLACKNWGEPQ